MNIIYLMGAGRSGTTLMATLLGGAEDVLTLGEMHQFLDHVISNGHCSCGENIASCGFWKSVYDELLSKYTLDELKKAKEHMDKVESHSRIPNSFFFHDRKYGQLQREILSIIETKQTSRWYLDSSKYIAKMLQLKRTQGLSIKTIYMVRDVRGVINSFGKNVQTPKKPLATLVYYSLINLFGQVVYLYYGKKQVFKMRYEDLMDKPGTVLTDLEGFLDLDLNDIRGKIERGDHFPMPHFIGGNRMTSSSKIRLKSDFKWKTSISRTKQALYYFATAPLMLLNKYRI